MRKSSNKFIGILKEQKGCNTTFSADMKTKENGPKTEVLLKVIIPRLKVLNQHLSRHLP